MAASNLKKIQHLFSRAGFGLSPGELLSWEGKHLNDALDSLFSTSVQFTYLETDGADEDNMAIGVEKNKRNVLDLNVQWLNQMGSSKAQLRHRMAFFWHGHFACRDNRPAFMAHLNTIHLKYAFGSLRDMLHEVVKSPAMMAFLNVQYSTKAHPNENLARELMELFTLGRGNYTENDVKEAARAFTGWSFDINNVKYVYYHGRHDDEIKHFRGASGNWRGEDIVNLLLDDKQTAQYVCSKIYRYFVNETPHTARINQLADVFYKSQYDIKTLLQTLFSADWFYEPQNIGCLIKSPVELLAGIKRQLGVEYANPKTLLLAQRKMGQLLFMPPNVAGWPGGKVWIDSSTLMFRLRLASLMLSGGDIEEKEDYEPDAQIANMLKQSANRALAQKAAVNINWDAINQQLPKDLTTAQLADLILLPQVTTPGKTNLLNLSVPSNTKEVLVQLMSLPEYQMR